MTGAVSSTSTSAASPLPPYTTGLQLWFEADSETYTDGAAVTNWHDKSGLGRDLTSGSASAAPTFRAAAVNGRAAIEFDGVANMLKTYNSTFTIPQPSTFFIVYRSLDPDTAARAFVFDSRNSGVRNTFGRPSASAIRMYSNSDFDVGGVTYPMPSYSIWSGTYNGGASKLYRDGALLRTGQTGSAALDSGFTVGGLNTAGTGGYDFSHSFVAEILYYSADLGDTDRQAVTDWLNSKYAVTTPPVAPTNTAAPTVSGNASDGSVLSATTGSWDGTPVPSYSYQWQRCNSGGGGCVPIGGAAASSYTLTSAEVGFTIRVAVTATNTGGSATAPSTVTAVVQAVPPANTALPVVTGSAAQGQTLSTSNGSWSGTQPIGFAYQWQRCDSGGGSCVPIDTATASSYTLTSAEVGFTIRATVTATNTGASTAANSAATGAVSPPPPPDAPVNTALPVVTGSAVEGQTLSTSNGSWTGTQPIGFGYQWQRCDSGGGSCVPIGVAAASSYTLTSAEVGFTIRATVTATNTAGSTAANSAATGTVFSLASATPPVAAGLQLWFEANSETYTDGAAVTNWHDKSGLGRDLTSGSASAAPTFRAAAVNGRAAIEFDGVANMLKTYNSTFTIPQPSTFFIVYRSLDTNVPGENDVFDSRNSSSRQDFGRIGTNQMEIYANHPLQFSGITHPMPSFELWNGTFNSTSSNIYRNGTLVTSGYAGGAALDGFTIGGLNSVDTGGYFFSHIVVAEILYYSASLSTSDRQTVTDWLNSKYAVTTPPVAPTNTAAPTVSGNASDGSVLSATTGSWDGTPVPSYSYQWQRCNSGGGGCVPIGGAAASSYTLTSAEVGFTIRVAVTATNTGGSATAPSTVTAVVQAVPPANTALPVVTGSAAQGQTLSTSNGSWSGTQPIGFAYQWQRCDSGGGSCVPIDTATASSYTLTSAEVGFTIRATVTATNTGASTAANSAATGAVSPPPPPDAPVNTALPVVTGSAVEGQTLSTSNGSWTGTQPIGFGYQWQRCDSGGGSCVPIGVAAASSYTLTSAEVGFTIRATVTATNTAGSTAANSAATGTVFSLASATPPVAAGLQLWFEANSETYTDGAAVTNWHDKSGLGRDLTSGTASAAPTFRAAAVNGRAAIEFDGVANMLKTYNSTFTIPQPSTFFIVYRSLDTNVPGENDVFDSRNSSSRQDFGRIGTNQMEIYANHPLQFSGITHPMPSFELWNGTFNSTSSNIYRNGTLVTSGYAGGAALDGFTIGGLNSVDTGGYFFSHIVVAEILYYSASLSTSDRQTVTDWLNSKYAVTTPPVAPTNTAAPTVSGNASDGSVLSATTGSWDGTPVPSYSYQWQRCNSGGGGCVPIGGAAASSYTLTPAEVGFTIRVAVTATNTGGSATAPSTVTAVVQAVPPANTALPVVTGSAAQGQTLSTSNGSWSGTQPIGFAYQWQRCDSGGGSCVPIDTATASSYTLTSAEVGFTIRATVTATNTGASTAANSAATGAVSPPPPPDAPVNTALPVVTGSAVEGQTLSTSNGSWTGTQPIGFGYQWQRCDSGGGSCVPIGVAATSSYTLTSAEVGFTIRATVTATNTAGSTAANSAATGTVFSLASATPPVAAGLQLWFEANSETYTDGAAVTNWHDKSGLGRDLTSGSASAAPTFRAAAVNGRAAIEFDGVANMLKTYNSTFTIPQPSTFFIVYRSLDPDTAARAFVFDSRNSSTRDAFGRTAAGTVSMYADNQVGVAGITFPFSTAELWSGTYNSTSSTLYRNGALVASGYAGGAALDGFTVGGLNIIGTDGYDLSHIVVAEILYYSGSLSTSDQQAMVNWLSAKYGL